MPALATSCQPFASCAALNDAKVSFGRHDLEGPLLVLGQLVVELGGQHHLPTVDAALAVAVGEVGLDALGRSTRARRCRAGCSRSCRTTENRISSSVTPGTPVIEPASPPLDGAAAAVVVVSSVPDASSSPEFPHAAATRPTETARHSRSRRHRRREGVRMYFSCRMDEQRVTCPRGEVGRRVLLAG